MTHGKKLLTEYYKNGNWFLFVAHSKTEKNKLLIFINEILVEFFLFLVVDVVFSLTFYNFRVITNI